MADHGCTNGSIDTVNYSSPIPVIGLSIAAVSALCMLMMLWDIGAGIFEKKSWLPCKAFKLNSVTLVLLGVVAKLPLDLTSSMPSPDDQLSKLSGTVLICISMGFFFPSLGIGNESESFTNMVALSIFVVTVAVDIGIQLHTGVIVLFYTEHIVVLVLMLVLLVLLWHTLLIIGNDKKIAEKECKALLAKGNRSMSGRLKVCYLYSYCSNPQFSISKNPMSASICIGSLVCSAILLQAALRSVILKNLKFCSGHSDYGWSMPFILVTQILTVLVGALAILTRWLTLFRRVVFAEMIVTDKYETQRKQTLCRWYRLQKFVISLSTITSSIIQLVIVAPSMLVCKLLRLYISDKLEYLYFDQEQVISARGYIVQKSVKAMTKLRDSCSKDSLNNLLQVLLDPAQKVYAGAGSYSSYRPLKEKDQVRMFVELTLLVKFGQVSIPKKHFQLIPSAFKEATNILHFIDNTLQGKGPNITSQLSYAKAVARDGDFSSLLNGKDFVGISDFDRALTIIEKLREKLLYDVIVGNEVDHMVKFINPGSRRNIEELSSCMKQMFIDMVHALIRQLPIAIYRSLSESSTENFERRAEIAMKYLFQAELTRLDKNVLKDLIRWEFPPADIFSLILDTTNSSTRSIDPLEIFRELVHPPIHGAESV